MRISQYPDMIIGDVPSNGEAKILVECDFKVTKKCKGTYLKCYKNILIGRKTTNGKDRCIACFNSLTKTGKQNYNFKYVKNDSFFELIDSELKAYLLGWVAGDGCLKKDGLYLSVHKKDVEICELFLKHLSPESKIKYRNYDNTANIIVNSVQIVKDLCRHLKVDIGKKSDKIVLPDLSNELLWPFLRGVFDSDGSIHRIDSKAGRAECNYCSTSQMIREQIKKLCQEYGINCHISKFNVVWRRKQAITFLDKLYDNASFALSRKKELYKLWKEKENI